MPVGSRTPPGVVHLHKFNALGIPADFNTHEETGDTTVTTLSDGLHIKNTGAGAAGVSYMRSVLHFGRQILFNIVASLVSGVLLQTVNTLSSSWSSTKTHSIGSNSAPTEMPANLSTLWRLYAGP